MDQNTEKESVPSTIDQNSARGVSQAETGSTNRGCPRFTLDALLHRMLCPKTYRLIGRCCGICAVFVLIASIGFSALGGSWFNGALLLGITWFIGDASAAILEELLALSETLRREKK